MAHHSVWNIVTAQTLVAELASLKGAVLPMLHALQKEFGYVDKAAIRLIADSLNLSHAEIYGVISFYHDFRDVPATGRVIKLCRAEACQALGCEALVSYATQHHDITVDAPSSKYNTKIETVYCLGNCALGPSALVDGELVGRIDATMLSEIISDKEITV